MKHYLPFLAVGMSLMVGLSLPASPRVVIDHNANDDASPEFIFKNVPSPSDNDAATSARFTLVEGAADPNAGGIAKLHDGQLPDSEDQPAENFFFQAGANGGRLQVDLGREIDISQVNTYSWHNNTRGPQIYRLYASAGTAENFAPLPKNGTNLARCGWTFIAAINTKSKFGESGGQYGVSISDTETNLGNYRYLLFDIAATENDDYFGNTFYSEIDAIDAKGPPPHHPAASHTFSIKTADGKCTISISSRQAPGLQDWAEHTLAPILADWYPKIAAMLPSSGFTAPTHCRITIKPMEGVAYTVGRNVDVSSEWLRKEIGREAVGSLIHESVHVIQQTGDAGDSPGWLTEGIADYIRWFKFEPQSHGADLIWMKRQGHFHAHYDDGYRATANFLNWVAEKYDKNIVSQLNADMRQGTYHDARWKEYTGKTAPQLGEEWKKDIELQLATKSSKTDSSK